MEPAKTVGISEHLEFISRVRSKGWPIWIFNLTDSLIALRDLYLAHSMLTDPPFEEEYKVNRKIYHIRGETSKFPTVG